MSRIARALRVIAIISATGGLCLPEVASAAPACCAVTSIAKSGQVTAKETNGAHTFQFQVADPALLRGLRVGSPVYANFDTKQVSLDGKKPCCKILNISTVAPGSGPAATGSAATQGTKSKSSGGGLGSIKPDTSNVKASEGDTAMAMRGRPPTSNTTVAKQSAPGASPMVQDSATTQVNPEAVGLMTTSDLVAKDLGFTGLGEITFNLVNRGEVGINVSAKQGGGAKLAAQAPPSGPPIKIDIYMGPSLIKSVFQPSMGGKQTRNFKENVPSTLPKPKCLEARNLKVVVDPQNQVKELHDDNNVTEANSARPCPDLAIKSIKRNYSGVLNETYTPKVTIINQGNAPSPPNQVWATSLPGEPWPVNGWPTLVPARMIPALAPGETTSFHTGGSVLSTNRTAVRIVLDRHYQIEESDESNNFKDERL